MSEKTIQPFASVRAVRSLSKGEMEPTFQAVQEFLQRFGYLKPQSYRDNHLDVPTALALTRYQQRNALEPTGAFDDQTRHQMTQHRCGMADLDHGLSFTIACSWPNPNLTYAFEDGTADVVGSGEFQAVRQAFATWAAAVPLTFTEVAITQNPDIVIDWRPAADPDYSMVGGTLAHADYPPGCAVVTTTLPKPVHFDDSEHLWVVGSVANGFDVETVALHELGHILGLQHSAVAGSVMFPTVSSNFTKRSLTADDLDGIRELYPAQLLSAGTYTIRQKSSGRFLDAYEESTHDFRLVTRTAQNNDSQRWNLAPLGTVYMLRQKSSGRYLDAYEEGSHDFRLVTRTAQNNDSQRWVAMPQSDGSVTLRQIAKMRFVDAYEDDAHDHQLVTRAAQANDTQRWSLNAVGTNTFTLQQRSSGRFADAYEDQANDFAVVSRTAQDNDSQLWILAPVGIVCTLRQEINDRFVDAYEESEHDFGVVTRTAQNNDTQRWLVLPDSAGSFTIRQLIGGRFLDAYESADRDFGAVTRTAQNNDTQRWLIDPV